MQRGTLLIVIALGLVLLFIIFVFSAAFYPIFATSVLFIILIVLAFVLSEEGFTHYAFEFENRFWTCISVLFVASCLHLCDSPLYIGDGNHWLGIIFEIFVGYGVHIRDRIVLSKKLTRGINIPTIDLVAYKEDVRENIQKKFCEVNQLLNNINATWVSSTLMGMFNGKYVLENEEHINTIFADSSKDEMDFMVGNADLAKFLYKVKDHRFLAQKNRSKLLKTIVDRIVDLSNASRVNLIDALQKMKLSAHVENEKYVKKIFENTKPDDLSIIKSMTDAKGDINTMHKLIYTDIRDDSIRQEILNIFAAKAKIQMGYVKIGGNKSKTYSKYAWRKILSDVDDTLTCSGGHYPAGIDTSYPKKTVYPGVLAFYRELDLGTTGPDIWDKHNVGNLVFLSARPHVYKDKSENHTLEKFKILVDAGKMHTCPLLLPGDLKSGSEFMVGDTYEPLALTKFRKFSEYAAIYPEFDYVFIGDNGQGDVRVLEDVQGLLTSDDRYRGSLLRGYIHLVQSIDKTYTKKLGTKSFQCENICYFVTYLEAALDAYQHKLIRLSGLHRIVEEAILDFKKIKWEEATCKKCKKSYLTCQCMIKKLIYDPRRNQRILELNAGITKANVIFRQMNLSTFDTIPFVSLFRPGALVETPLGRGVVLKFRPSDGIYEVALQLGLLPNRDKLFKAYLWVESITNQASTSASSASSASKQKSKSSTYSMFSWVTGTATVKTVKTSSGSEPEWIAWTPYGLAYIVNDKRPDKIVELELMWGAALYMPASQVIYMYKRVVSEKPASSSGETSHLSMKLRSVLSPERRRRSLSESESVPEMKLPSANTLLSKNVVDAASKVELKSAPATSKSERRSFFPFFGGFRSGSKDDSVAASPSQTLTLNKTSGSSSASGSVDLSNSNAQEDVFLAALSSDVNSGSINQIT